MPTNLGFVSMSEQRRMRIQLEERTTDQLRKTIQVATHPAVVELAHTILCERLNVRRGQHGEQPKP